MLRIQSLSTVHPLEHVEQSLAVNSREEDLKTRSKGMKRNALEPGHKIDAPFACILTGERLVILNLADDLPTLQMRFIISAIPIEAEDVRRQ